MNKMPEEKSSLEKKQLDHKKPISYICSRGCTHANCQAIRNHNNLIDENVKELRGVADKMQEDENRSPEQFLEFFKQVYMQPQNHKGLLLGELRAFCSGYTLAKKEDKALLVEAKGNCRHCGGTGTNTSAYDNKCIWCKGTGARP